ncbi:HAD family hydrolase [Kitasatospora phosalacinea]|uniref:HAD family hydrolase n=1 Tax=Kitasatospora phosalacinea TaxID=2065 RepID=UPI00364795D0
MTGRQVRCAFFDVDETLIRRKSLAGFLGHYLQELERADAPGVAELRLRAEALVRRAGRWRIGRSGLNRDYYRLFRGHEAARLERAGRAWFAQELGRGDFFRPGVLAALDGHRALGHRVVLVSGSFGACLDPIGAHVGADLVACTRPVDRDGLLTGEIEVPLVGRAKAAEVRRALARFGAEARASYAYGDHASDLPLLLAVGRPVVVGADPLLTRWAAVAGWSLLAD